MSHEIVLVLVIIVTVKERLARVTIFVLVEVVVTWDGVIVDTAVLVTEGTVVVNANNVISYSCVIVVVVLTTGVAVILNTAVGVAVTVD